MDVVENYFTDYWDVSRTLPIESSLTLLEHSAIKLLLLFFHFFFSIPNSFYFFLLSELKNTGLATNFFFNPKDGCNVERTAVGLYCTYIDAYSEHVTAFLDRPIRDGVFRWVV